MSEPLDDMEVQDELHRIAFDLETKRGLTVRGDTALRTVKAAVMMILTGLVVATENEPEHPPRPD